MVNRLANVLKDHGVKKGDVVCIYMPVSPLAVAAMLACARIGAPHRSVLLKSPLHLILKDSVFKMMSCSRTRLVFNTTF